MKKQEQLPVENLAYEQALAELEGIVAKHTVKLWNDDLL